MEIQEHQWRPIVEGIAAIAVALAEMGTSEEEAQGQVTNYLVYRLQVDIVDLVPILREAAAAVGSFPQPPDDSAESLERGRPIREMLGLPEPAERLASALRAREWLEKLADRIARLDSDQ